MPRVMRNIRIKELSLVDNPANQHSHVSVFKRADPAVEYWKRDFTQAERDAAAESGTAMSDGSFPIKNAKDLANAIKAIGRAKDQAAARKHIIQRAKDLGLTASLPEEWTPKSKIDAIVKGMYAVACDDGTGAIGFSQLLQANERRRLQWDAQEQLYPLFDSLNESIRRTAADQSQTLPDRMEMIRQSVQDFINAVADKVPDVEQELAKLLKADPASAGFFDAGDDPGDHTANKETDMAGDEKRVAELEGRITAFETKSKADDAVIADLKSKLDASEKGKVEAEGKLAEATKSMEIAKTDEVILLPDPADATKKVEVRKSVVGDQAWLMFKAQDAALKTEIEKGIVAKYETRAKTELGTLPGDVAVKGLVLRAVEEIENKDVREAAIKMLTGGAAALKTLTKPIGHDGDIGGDGPESKLDQLVKKHMVDNKVSDEAKAYSAVLNTPEGKALYAEMTAPASRAA